MLFNPKAIQLRKRAAQHEWRTSESNASRIAHDLKWHSALGGSLSGPQRIRAGILRARGRGGCGARGKSRFDRRTLFVIIPCLNQDERNWLIRWKDSAPEIESLLICFSATRCNLTIQAPRRLTVVELCPSAANDYFVRILVAHGLVKAGEGILSPIAPIRRPTLRTNIEPRIKPVKSIRIRTGRRFINEQWSGVP